VAPCCFNISGLNQRAKNDKESDKVTTYRTDAADPNPLETQDWIESLLAVVGQEGQDRAQYLLRRVLQSAARLGASPVGTLNTEYVNTISADEEPPFPGDEAMEKRIRRMVRWNAVAMVHRANVKYPGIGGHLSTYASSATLYEVGFNHFFRGKDHPGGGDHIFYQGHAAPGMYARAFLEGRLSAETMQRFRRDAERGLGLSSYPHPRLMPDFWEHPTVSMGLGPLCAIYQARFDKYLHHRSIKDTSQQRVWAFLGDGETDEPESLGALSMAGRERLDNLIFVVNCNLQRLDGPVRGNGKIIQELETVFRGAGWNVIKVIWGPEWDRLLQRDKDGILLQRMTDIVDGQWQKYATVPGGYTRQHFFGNDPRLLEMVKDLSDEQIRKLRRGGHSNRKIFAAYDRATKHQGQPTVILAHTVKGWTLGEGFEGVNVTHQKKKLEVEELRQFRDLLELPVRDEELDEAPLYHPGADSAEIRYMLERRAVLGGQLPSRRNTKVTVEMPRKSVYDEFLAGTGKAEASTTMVFARLFAKLLREPNLGKHVVPIIPDEARTFGMDALFSMVGIYSSYGQLYEPPDKGKVLYYRESRDGQVLEEGINEAGSMASFIAAGSAYSTHGQPMIPFYIFYSMFGFQRTGDLMWAAGDAMAKGFLLGATAGRTTLQGEGLQHDDGHSHVLASTLPSCVCYDPAFAYELSTIIEDGIVRMYERDERILYYITLYNENYVMPQIPAETDADRARIHEGILRGLYLYQAAADKKPLHVQLFGSGPQLNDAIRAAGMLANYGVSADVWSVTSYQELRRDAINCERYNRLHPNESPKRSFIERTLEGVSGPFVAVSDHMKLLSDHIARWVPGRFIPLGTDGFGISDTRRSLRRHFEIDPEFIVLGALDALRLEGKLSNERVAEVIGELGIDSGKLDPVTI
jgi:pyruvate dehydrogenase E1 component